MKWFFTITLFALFIFSLCSPKKENNSSAATSIQKAENNISIKKIGTIEFTKSYSFIQSTLMSDKEKDKLFKEVSEGNPMLARIPSNDTVLLKKFEELNIVKGKELLIDNFKYGDNPDSTLPGANGKQIQIHFKKDTVRGTNNRIVIVDGKATAETRAAMHYSLKYAFLDIITGGNKELVLLEYHYISNTEIYYLEVYEIKNAD